VITALPDTEPVTGTAPAMHAYGQLLSVVTPVDIEAEVVERLVSEVIVTPTVSNRRTVTRRSAG
jgi:hypothetical protein